MQREMVMDRNSTSGGRGGISTRFPRFATAAGLAVVLGGASRPAAAQVTTVRTNLDSAGAEANDYTAVSALSADGRYSTMWSYATNLAPGDTNAEGDVFFHDRYSGATELVSVNLS